MPSLRLQYTLRKLQFFINLMSKSPEHEVFDPQKTRSLTPLRQNMQKQTQKEEVIPNARIAISRLGIEKKVECFYQGKNTLTKITKKQSEEEDLLQGGDFTYQCSMKQAKQWQQQEDEALLCKKQKIMNKKITSSKARSKFVLEHDELFVEENRQQKATRNFDEKLIGKSQFNFQQLKEGDQIAKVGASYTLEQKLKSKAVKLRIEGLEELLDLLSINPNSFECQEVQISKIIKQTNPVCLPKALLCFYQWIQIEKSWGQEEVKNVIEYGYINAKQTQKQLASQIIDSLYEKNSDAVEVSIIAGLKGKQSRNLAGYIAVINELLTLYGIERMKFLKPYFPEIVTVLNREKSVNVKSQGIKLLKESYKLLSKDVVDEFIFNLKDGYKKELDIFWEEYDAIQFIKTPQQLKLKEGLIKKKIDVYQFSEAVDIFKKYNIRWSENVLDQDSSNDKVHLLKDFVNNANVGKIANTGHQHMTNIIKKLISDNNINVVIWTLKTLVILAKGLRKNLADFAKKIFPAIISKFREKKIVIVEEIFQTLNHLTTYCISIQDVHEEISNGLQDKNPNMKVNVMNWIEKIIEQKIQQNELTKKASQSIQGLFPIFDKLLQDEVVALREHAMASIQKIKQLLGIDCFDKSRRKKKNQDRKSSSVSRQARASTPLKKRKVTTQNQERLLNQKEEKKQQVRTMKEQLQILARDLNHYDWQKRKQAAETLMEILQQSGEIKMTYLDLTDLIRTLQSRIADPNKHITKIFIRLAGVVFDILPEKQYKTHIKTFILALIEGLSDKTEVNRKQIYATLQKLSIGYGKWNLLSLLGQYLDTDKDLRFEVANIILQNIQYLAYADLKNYPKGIIRLLMDKFKKARSIGEQLFQATYDRIGIDVFRSLAETQLPSIQSELNEFFDRYDCINESISQISKSFVNPSHAKPPRSVKKRAPSKEDQRRSSQRLSSKQSKPLSVATTNCMESAQGNQKVNHYQVFNGYFADLKKLKAYKISRAEQNEEYPWEAYQITRTQEKQMVGWLKKSLKEDLVSSMLSYDYRKIIEAAEELIFLCQDEMNHPELKQISDILIQWIIMRLWGGNPSLLSIIQLIPFLLQISERKKQQLYESEINLIIRVLREYIISASLINTQPSQSIFLIVRSLTFLTSPSKLFKKILSEFSIELNNLHRHLPESITFQYRTVLCELVKKSLIQYIGQDDCLLQTSKISELKNDQEFINILFGVINEKILKGLGFSNYRMKSGEQLLNQEMKTNKASHSSQSFSENYHFLKDDSDIFADDSLAGSQKRELSTLKTSTQTQEDFELKPILELLHKEKTFEKGLTMLNDYIIHHQWFKLTEYLTAQQYSKKFILLVIKGLKRKNTQNFLFEKKTQQSFEQSICSKMKMLKMKFEEVQTNCKKDENSESEKNSRTEEIKKKIQMMKHKIQPLVKK